MAISNNNVGIRPGVCTSTTRPVNPYVGQFIFETDTLLSKYWSGSAWSNFVGGVSSLTAGTGVSVSSTTGAVTASIGQSVATTATPTFGNLTVSNAGNASVTVNAGAGSYAMQYFAVNGTNQWHYEVSPSGASWALVESGVAQRLTVSETSGNLKLETGQIILPAQYTYNGDNTGGASASFTTQTAVRPPNAYINNGSAFNTGNGRFTVPIPGYVLCSFNSLINRPNLTSHAYVHFEVDGVRKSARNHTVYDILGNYQTLNNTAIVYCPANSYVTCILGTEVGASAYAGEWGLGLTFRYLG